jgi:malonyl-CoA O-methyltransferase
MNVVIPSKKKIAMSFSRRASRYCPNAFIQRRILDRCVELVEASGLSHLSWLDAGCGAGLLGAMLDEKELAPDIFRTDLAFESLKSAAANKKGRSFSVQSDIEFLPFKTDTFNGIVVSSVLHWLADPLRGLKELARVLKPDGRVVFAVFLEGSFHEVCLLRQRINLAVPVRYADDKKMNALMQECGLETIDFSIQSEVYYFHSAWEVLKYLSDIGSTAISGRRLSRSGLMEFCEEYETLFRNNKGVPLSYRYGWGIAKKRTVS